MILQLFVDNFDLSDYYLIGIDVAAGGQSRSAIEVFSFRRFEQIAESYARVTSVMKFGKIAIGICKWLIEQLDGRVVITIERNNVGITIIEQFCEDNLDDYLYHTDKLDKKGRLVERTFGLKTTPESKALMTSLFYNHVVDDPSIIKSQSLYSELHHVQRNRRGSLEIPKGYPSDLFMASCFCAYTRKVWYDRIIPYVKMDDSDVQREPFISREFIIKDTLPDQRKNTFFGIPILTSDEDKENLNNELDDWTIIL